MSELKGFKEGTKSVDVLRALHSERSLDFQNRVPQLTQDNIKEYGSAIMEDTRLQNEWLHALVNRIGLVVIRSKSFQNPLARFKKGFLEMGETVQEIFIGLVDEKLGGGFPDEDNLGDVYKVTNPDIYTIYHKVNRKGRFDVTIDQQKLRTAFTSNRNLDEFVTQIIESLYVSDELNEFLYMKQLMKNYDDKGLFHKINIKKPVDKQSVQDAVVEIRAMSNMLTFMSTKYNSSNVPTLTPKTKQVILVNPKFDALMDVNVLAEAFHMSKAEFLASRILIDDFGGMENVAAILMDEDWFMVYDQLFEFTDVFNSKYIYWNYFLHHNQVLSTSRFANAIVFTWDTLEDVTSVEIKNTETEVEKGSTLLLTTTVEGGYSKAVTYQIKGSISQETNINDKGYLYIGLDEKGKDIEVLAISVQDSSKTDTISFKVK